ncbi:uncharacterized protein LOC102914538 [Peromyscus maniculatus bairdii]|uniref:uncharacterized protein LOC102914538 n=1 Tax=Peromyscus maniculatus bairdii TaxID=230844 RepID=UPI003FCF0F6B
MTRRAFEPPSHAQTHMNEKPELMSGSWTAESLASSSLDPLRILQTLLRSGICNPGSRRGVWVEHMFNHPANSSCELCVPSHRVDCGALQRSLPTSTGPGLERGCSSAQPCEVSLSPEHWSKGYDSCCLPQEKRKPEFLKGLPDHLKLYSEFLGKQPWFAGDKITYVDFLVYDVLDQHRIFEPKCLDAFPNLKDFLARFEGLKKISAYMKSSRFLPRPVYLKLATWVTSRTPHCWSCPRLYRPRGLSRVHGKRSSFFLQYGVPPLAVYPCVSGLEAMPAWWEETLSHTGPEAH